MKNAKAELDVDFISGLGGPTPDEEKAITDFIRSRNKKPAKAITPVRSSIASKHKARA